MAPHRHLPGRPGRDAGEAREEGPPGLRVGQGCRPASGAKTARTATGSRPKSCWSPAAESSSWISRTETAHRRRTAIPCLPPKPPRRWMTAKFRSSGLPPSRITQGQSPPTRRGAGPSFLESPSSPPPHRPQTVDADRPHCALRSPGPVRSRQWRRPRRRL